MIFIIKRGKEKTCLLPPWRQRLSLSSRNFDIQASLKKMLEAKTASVFAQMVRNTRYPWRIASQHLYNNNNNNSVIYSLEELWIRHRGSHKHICLRESRNKRRYILTWYEQEKKKKNPDKGIFISVETRTAAPTVPSSVWKGVASCIWLWGLSAAREGDPELLWALWGLKPSPWHTPGNLFLRA